MPGEGGTLPGEAEAGMRKRSPARQEGGLGPRLQPLLRLGPSEPHLSRD